jgi:hypothetical protein
MNGNTKESFNYDDLFPERWLHADDLPDAPVTGKITAAYQEQLKLPGGPPELAGILTFAGVKKEYVLNKTNAMVLVGLWGKYSAEWVGHKIVMTKVPDQSGKSASGYRILFVGSPDLEKDTKVAQPQGAVRVIKATGKNKASTAPDLSESEPEEVAAEANTEAQVEDEVEGLETPSWTESDPRRTAGEGDPERLL